MAWKSRGVLTERRGWHCAYDMPTETALPRRLAGGHQSSTQLYPRAASVWPPQGLVYPFCVILQTV